METTRGPTDKSIQTSIDSTLRIVCVWFNRNHPEASEYQVSCLFHLLAKLDCCYVNEVYFFLITDGEEEQLTWVRKDGKCELPISVVISSS